MLMLILLTYFEYTSPAPPGHVMVRYLIASLRMFDKRWLNNLSWCIRLDSRKPVVLKIRHLIINTSQTFYLLSIFEK